MLFLSLARADEVAATDWAGLVEVLSGRLPARYKPVLAPSRASQAAALGMDETKLPPMLTPSSRFSATDDAVMFAELYTAPGAVLGILVRVSGRARYRMTDSGIEVGAPEESPARVDVFSIQREVGTKALDGFVALLNERANVNLDRFYYPSQRFAELVDEGLTPPDAPTEAERLAARLLVEKPTRTLAIAIKSSAGLLLGGVGKQLEPADQERTDEIVKELSDAGIVSKEVVVICTQTSAQVARAATRKKVEASSRSGVTCACGRPLADERIEEALTITDHGRDLLDGSRWMSVLVIDELQRLGVPLERMLVEQKAGGDELDCLADISGELAFFELKDKEFNLGNAYSFGAKIGIFRPDHKVIVTTEYVGNDAKEHFARAQVPNPRAYAEPERPVVAIEGLDSLSSGLESLVSDIYSQDAAALLRDVLPRAAVDPSDVLQGISANEIGGKPAAKPRSRAQASRRSSKKR